MLPLTKRDESLHAFSYSDDWCPPPNLQYQERLSLVPYPSPNSSHEHPEKVQGKKSGNECELPMCLGLAHTRPLDIHQNISWFLLTHLHLFPKLWQPQVSQSRHSAFPKVTEVSHFLDFRLPDWFATSVFWWLQEKWFYSLSGFFSLWRWRWYSFQLSTKFCFILFHGCILSWSHSSYKDIYI